MKSCYIHIPFCSAICSYCDFCKMIYNDRFVDNYLNSLENEIIEGYKGEVLKTIYIGGGTPSCLSINQLRKLFSIIKRIKLEKEYEFTIEANINDLTEEKLSLFKDSGVNRLSIGVETVNERFFSFLNRGVKREDVLEKVNLAKKYFSNINIDLMYAFPNQKVEEVIDDLTFVIGLNSTHISIYSLIIESNTKIYIDGVNPIDEDIDSNMYYNIIDILKNNGFEHYEISNFCKPGFESKHNLVYWDNDKYYGFGLGASGYVGNIRYTNTRSINKYLNGDYRYITEEITKEIDMENEVIFGLRKVKGISKVKFLEKYCFDIEHIFDIINLVENGMLEIDGDYIYIPKDKLYVSNSILINFMGGSSNE